MLLLQAAPSKNRRAAAVPLLMPLVRRLYHHLFTSLSFRRLALTLAPKQGLRHADSSDKLKGLMSMLQKKRTMRALQQPPPDLDESTRSPGSVILSPGSSSESLVDEPPLPPAALSRESSQQLDGHAPAEHASGAASAAPSSPNSVMAQAMAARVPPPPAALDESSVLELYVCSGRPSSLVLTSCATL